MPSVNTRVPSLKTLNKSVPLHCNQAAAKIPTTELPHNLPTWTTCLPCSLFPGMPLPGPQDPPPNRQCKQRKTAAGSRFTNHTRFSGLWPLFKETTAGQAAVAMSCFGKARLLLAAVTREQVICSCACSAPCAQ